jgi:hypothetical protein
MRPSSRLRHDGSMAPDVATDRISNLITARIHTAASLGEWLLGIACCKIEEYEDVSQWNRARISLNRIESQSVALYRQAGGLSWGALADSYGVTRQSLFRRLSSSADYELEQAQWVSSIALGKLRSNIGAMHEYLDRLDSQTATAQQFASFAHSSAAEWGKSQMNVQYHQERAYSRATSLDWSRGIGG